jgi:hypothetical protein
MSRTRGPAGSLVRRYGGITGSANVCHDSQAFTGPRGGRLGRGRWGLPAAQPRRRRRAHAQQDHDPPILALPGCAAATAPSEPLPKVHTHFVQVGGKPFGVVVTRNHFGFVSLGEGAPLVVMNTAKFVPTTIVWSCARAPTATQIDRRRASAGSGLADSRAYGHSKFGTTDMSLISKLHTPACLAISTEMWSRMMTHAACSAVGLDA